MTTTDQQPQQFKVPNATALINRAHVKALLLETARFSRAHKFTRVSSQALIECNEAVRQWCVSRVKQQPSAGKTIQ